MARRVVSIGLRLRAPQASGTPPDGGRWRSPAPHMTTDKPHRNAFSGPVQVALAEADPARRVALGALMRQSRHLELAATLHDDDALLEWLASDAHADVLMAGPLLRRT